MTDPRQMRWSSRHTAARMIAHGVATATAFLCVSCADSTTASKSASQFVAYPQGLRGVIPDAEEITVTQTTEAGEKGQAPTSRRVKVVKLKHGHASVPPQLIGSLTKPITAASLAATGAFLPRLSYPSSRAQSQRGHWTATHPYGDGTDATLEASGDNDEPASVVRLIRNGHLVGTVRRTFQRDAMSWELVRQESTTEDGRYRDVIEVKRKDGGVKSWPSLLRGTAGVRSSLSLGVSPSTPLFDEVCGGGAGEQWGDPAYAEDKCAQEKSVYDWATLEAVAVAVEMGAACLTTVVAGPAGVLLCLAANAHLLKALNDEDNAANAYEVCKRFYMSHSGPCDDGTEFDASGYGEESGASPGETVLISTCWIWFQYDMESGDILDSLVLYCE